VGSVMSHSLMKIDAFVLGPLVLNSELYLYIKLTRVCQIIVRAYAYSLLPQLLVPLRFAVVDKVTATKTNGDCLFCV
jgi:hypothetical protein